MSVHSWLGAEVDGDGDGDGVEGGDGVGDGVGDGDGVLPPPLPPPKIMSLMICLATSWFGPVPCPSPVNREIIRKYFSRFKIFHQSACSDGLSR